jgi:hypothetical protein
MLTIAVVKAVRLVRRMRGQTRAQLIVAADGQEYVVKYINNTVGRRVLVNELISSLMLKNLGIRTPNMAFVSVDEAVLERGPEKGVVSGSSNLTSSLGLHFGCRFVGSESVRVYDFLPDQMLSLVTNRNDFLGALVFDKWFSNSDARQAIFYRENSAFVGRSLAKQPWLAEIIDHESAFHGQEWTFRNSPPQGLHPRLAIYGTNPTMPDFKPWLDRIEGLDAEFFQALFQAVPEQWIAGDEGQLLKLLRKLQDRRNRLPGLLEDALVYIRAKQGRMPVAIEEAMKRVDPNEECLAG